jgi:hypothetical protein
MGKSWPYYNERGIYLRISRRRHPFTKIGYAAQRKHENALQESLAKRIKEHEKCGWRNPSKVLQYRVPHAHKVEKLIHIHEVIRAWRR